MALRGNLKDFSLPDVFQLVTFSKKTGVLRITRSDDAEGSVWFRDGDVFFAQSNWHGEPLGQRLVQANRITPSALQKALETRRAEPEGGRRLGTILVDEGYITEKVLEAFVQEQIQDTIFDLMRWDEGDFDFEVLPGVVDEDIGLSVSIENIVMEGSRRLEEWTRIKKKIPSMDIVFKMATAPGEGTFEISLKPIEWNLLLLVDGTRTVSELAAETNRTDFEVARIMYGLFSAGLLEVAEDDEVERLRAERAEREAIVAELRAQERAAKEAADAQAHDRAALETVEGPPQVPEPVESMEAGVVGEERTEPEVPQFLAGGDTSVDASEEDMAVFEEMMDAVLQTPPTEPVAEQQREPEPLVTPEPPAIEPPPEPEPPSIEPEPAPEPELPEIEPEPAPEPEIAPVPAELPAIELPPEPEPPVIEPEPAPEPELPEIGSDVETEAPAEGAAGETQAEEPRGPALTGDLEADLRALGLGELPTQKLLEPVGEDEVELAGEPIESRIVFEEREEIPPPPSAEDAGTPEGAIFQPETEAPVEVEESRTDLADEQAPGSVDEETGASERVDFSGILESLEELGEEEPEIVHTESLDEQRGGPAGGVISTDAFLADISPDELGVGLSSGLGDELSALTGAESQRRPSTNVNKLPEPGRVEIHRDRTVNKELVLKIIEGIEKL